MGNWIWINFVHDDLAKIGVMIEQLQARLMKNANSNASKGSISIWVRLGGVRMIFFSIPAAINWSNFFEILKKNKIKQFFVAILGNLSKHKIVANLNQKKNK